MKTTDGGQLSDFIEGLGPGQLVGRQVLGASSLGDIQISLCHQKGCLEVEVIRARGLQVKKNKIFFCFQPNSFSFIFIISIFSASTRFKSTSSTVR